MEEQYIDEITVHKIVLTADKAQNSSIGSYEFYQVLQAYQQKKLRLSQVIMSNCFYNITAQFKTNQFQLEFQSSTSISVILSNGYYTMSELTKEIEDRVLAETGFQIQFLHGNFSKKLRLVSQIPCKIRYNDATQVNKMLGFIQPLNDFRTEIDGDRIPDMIKVKSVIMSTSISGTGNLNSIPVSLQQSISFTTSGFGDLLCQQIHSPYFNTCSGQTINNITVQFQTNEGYPADLSNGSFFQLELEITD